MAFSIFKHENRSVSIWNTSRDSGQNIQFGQSFSLGETSGVSTGAADEGLRYAGFGAAIAVQTSAQSAHS